MFENYQSIAVHFGLTGTTQTEILQQLKAMRNDLHPDKNGGHFASIEDEKRFHEVTSAIERLQDQSNSQLITISQLTELIKTVRDIDRVSNTKNEMEEKKEQLDKTLTSTILQTSARFKVPKIATAVITSVFSLIWFLPKQVSEHPVLGRLIDINGRAFTYIWMVVLGGTVCLWVFSYLLEAKLQRLHATVQTDIFQKNTFLRFLSSVTHNIELGESKNHNVVFSKSQLVNFIYKAFASPKKKTALRLIVNFYTAGMYSLYENSTLEITVVEKLVDLILKRHILKGTLTEEPASFDEIYKTELTTNDILALRMQVEQLT